MCVSLSSDSSGGKPDPTLTHHESNALDWNSLEKTRVDKTAESTPCAVVIDELLIG
jgi:hypothetical protein